MTVLKKKRKNPDVLDMESKSEGQGCFSLIYKQVMYLRALF